MYYLLLFFTFFSFLPIFFILKKRRSSNRLPPGSLGIPIIGQSLSFARALRDNTAEKWLEDRVNKYGPISKLTLFGKPTIFIHGQEANKFVFTGNSLNNQQPTSVQTLLGKRNLTGVSGQDHKRLRGALMTFLKPEVLKQYVGKMDREIKKHFEMHWQGKETVTEIVDNVRSVMFAGYDTIATLTTFMIRHLASDPVVYAEILKEQEEIDAQKSSSEELLTWDDLAKMKYTWRVALEILRIIPPAFGGFRRTQKDTEFGGYVIPEGWQ
ncbi:Cytochrome p450, partial [Thalictrum thalictroides]